MVKDTARQPAASGWSRGLRQALDSAEVRRAAPILLLILAIQSLGALSRNKSVFVDEALYLWAGRRIVDALLSGSPIPREFERFFPGLPYLYSPLAGVVDAIGGLGAARLLSLAFVLATTLAVYWLTRHFSNPAAGLFAAALFAWQGGALFIARLATQDAMCLMLLALSACLALNAARRTGWLAVLPVGAGLLLASLAKYVGALLIPAVLALLFLETWPQHGWRAALKRTLLAGAIVGLGWLITFALVGDELSIGLAVTAPERDVVFGEKQQDLLNLVIRQSGLLMGLGLFGAVTVRLLEPRAYRRWLVALVYAGAGLLLPAGHIYFQEFGSLNRHLAFGGFFLALLAGHGLAQFFDSNFVPEMSRRRWLYIGGSLICLVQLLGGIPLSRWFLRDWDDTTPLVQFLSPRLTPGAQVLSDNPDILRYSFYERPGIRWVDLYWFEYPDSAGRTLQGNEAYTAAIADGYFDFIVLGHMGSRPTGSIEQAMKTSQRYRLVSELRFVDAAQTGIYEIWQQQDQADAAESAVAVEPAGDDLDGFEDDFQELNPQRWNRLDNQANGSPFANGWRADHASVQAGQLVLVLDKAPCPAGCAGQPYASGELYSKATFGYGRYGVDLRAAKGSGIISTSFMVYDRFDDGTIRDGVALMLLGRDTTRLHTQYWVDGKGSQGEFSAEIDLGFDAAQDYHSYGFEWAPDLIRWYVDGKLVREVKEDGEPLPTHPGTLIANMWAGDATLSNWLGIVEFSGPPFHTYIDKIAFDPIALDSP